MPGMSDKNFKVKKGPSKSAEDCIKDANMMDSHNGAACRDHDLHQGSAKKLGKK